MISRLFLCLSLIGLCHSTTTTLVQVGEPYITQCPVKYYKQRLMDFAASCEKTEFIRSSEVPLDLSSSVCVRQEDSWSGGVTHFTFNPVFHFTAKTLGWCDHGPDKNFCRVLVLNPHKDLSVEVSKMGLNGVLEKTTLTMTSGECKESFCIEKFPSIIGGKIVYIDKSNPTALYRQPGDKPYSEFSDIQIELVVNKTVVMTTKRLTNIPAKMTGLKYPAYDSQFIESFTCSNDNNLDIYCQGYLGSGLKPDDPIKITMFRHDCSIIDSQPLNRDNGVELSLGTMTSQTFKICTDEGVCMNYYMDEQQEGTPPPPPPPAPHRPPPRRPIPPKEPKETPKDPQGPPKEPQGTPKEPQEPTPPVTPPNDIPLIVGITLGSLVLLVGCGVFAWKRFSST